MMCDNSFVESLWHSDSTGRFCNRGASALSTSRINPPMVSRHWCWWWMITLALTLVDDDTEMLMN